MENLVAACGINCAICIGHLRKKNTCPGCNERGESKKAKSRENCKLKNCEKHEGTESIFCIDCGDTFPCKRMKHLEKRYTTKYDVSPIENMRMIKDEGMNAFLQNEEEKWKCAHCGAVLSMHRDICIECGETYRESPQNK